METQVLVAAAILVALSLFIHIRKLLDLKGILLASLFGAITFYFGGFRLFAALIIFYVAAEFATSLGREGRKGHEQRTIANIIGNGGPAIISIVLGNHLAFFGALSAALADTVSSEIGMTSKRKPVMITTFRGAERGIDGAITLRGVAAGLLGAVLIGSLYYFLAAPSIEMLVLLAATGVFGSLLDSLLGATVQRAGLLDNNQVNFIASGATAVLMVLVSAAMHL